MKHDKISIIYNITDNNAHMFTKEYQSELVLLLALHGLIAIGENLNEHTIMYRAETRQQYDYAVKLFKNP